MIDHKTLIGELRAAADECLYDTADLCRRAADALVAAAGAAPQADVDTAALIAEARALAVRKVEDSADAEALQIMLGLLCDRLEQGGGQ